MKSMVDELVLETTQKSSALLKMTKAEKVAAGVLPVVIVALAFGAGLKGDPGWRKKSQ